MAEPDCEGCAIAGIRSCDKCGGPVLDHWRGAFGEDVCAYCRDEFPIGEVLRTA